MRLVADSDSVAGKKVFLWEGISPEKTHEVVDSLADIADDADEENLRIKVSSISESTKQKDSDSDNGGQIRKRPLELRQ